MSNDYLKLTHACCFPYSDAGPIALMAHRCMKHRHWMDKRDGDKREEVAA